MRNESTSRERCDECRDNRQKARPRALGGSVTAALLLFLFALQGEAAPPILDPALVSEGAKLYEKLKHDHPDTQMLPDHDLAPHTINIEIFGAGNLYASLDLYMPTVVWTRLTAHQRDALVALIRSKILDAQAHPERYATLDPRAEAYPGEVESIREIKDDAWQIHVGKLDDEGYLNEEAVVLKGSEYTSGYSGKSVLVYANPKDDPVYNSVLDGSVAQAKDYHQKHLNDPDSVKYSEWTKVVKTEWGTKCQ